MRQVLLTSIILSWFAVTAATTASGFASNDPQAGLLQQMQQMLTGPGAWSFSAEAAAATITAVVAVTLSVMLWTLMFALTTGEEDRSERVTALAVAFAWTLLQCAIWIIVAMATGVTAAFGPLFAIIAMTMISAMAAGGVEVIWGLHANALNGDENAENSIAKRLTSHMAATSAKLASFTPDKVERET